MITKLYIPVPNIATNFDYNNEIKESDYIKMLNDNYSESYYDIKNFMSYGVKPRKKYNYYFEVDNQSYNDENYYTFEEIEAFITDMNDRNIDSNNIIAYTFTNEMFILIFDVNIETLTEDTESELKFWISDSMKINNDNNINENLKILSLPKKTLKILLNNINYNLINCRILDDYSNIETGKLKFAILIEKITK